MVTKLITIYKLQQLIENHLENWVVLKYSFISTFI